MKVIILSAGQGRRLLPLTAGMPKCGVKVGARSILEWQLREISRCDIDEVTIVTGFHADYVDEMVENVKGPPIRTVHNPFYDASDNLGTCWIARYEMADEFVILNGDTLFEAEVMRKLLSTKPSKPITLAIDTKKFYDEDDMKVVFSRGELARVGKKLPLDKVNGESIGMIVFRGNGPEIFVNEIDRLIRTAKGLKLWYLSAIDSLANRGVVNVCDINGLSWCEVDDHADLSDALSVVSGWNDL